MCETVREGKVCNFHNYVANKTCKECTKVWRQNKKNSNAGGGASSSWGSGGGWKGWKSQGWKEDAKQGSQGWKEDAKGDAKQEQKGNEDFHKCHRLYLEAVLQQGRGSSGRRGTRKNDHDWETGSDTTCGGDFLEIGRAHV